MKASFAHRDSQRAENANFTKRNASLQWTRFSKSRNALCITAFFISSAATFTKSSKFLNVL